MNDGDVSKQDALGHVRLTITELLERIHEAPRKKADRLAKMEVAANALEKWCSFQPWGSDTSATRSEHKEIDLR